MAESKTAKKYATAIPCRLKDGGFSKVGQVVTLPQLAEGDFPFQLKTGLVEVKKGA